MLIASILLSITLPAVPEIDTRVVMLQDTEALEERCGSAVYACTKFVGTDLSVACVSTDAGWFARGTARVIALMYLLDTGYTAHEWTHIMDIKRGAGELLGGLQSMRFDSEASCRDRARIASARFRDDVRAMAVESNRRRH